MASAEGSWGMEGEGISLKPCPRPGVIVCLQLAVWPSASGVPSLSFGFPMCKWGPLQGGSPYYSCSSLYFQEALSHTSSSRSPAGSGW